MQWFNKNLQELSSKNPGAIEHEITICMKV